MIIVSIISLIQSLFFLQALLLYLNVFLKKKKTVRRCQLIPRASPSRLIKLYLSLIDNDLKSIRKYSTYLSGQTPVASFFSVVHGKEPHQYLSFSSYLIVNERLTSQMLRFLVSKFCYYRLSRSPFLVFHLMYCDSD